MGRKLNPAEAQQLGLDDSPRSGGKRKLSAQEAEALGLGGEGAAAPPQEDKPTFELPYPERPVEGLALDEKTRLPMTSTFGGPANPTLAAALALTRGASMGFGAKAAAKIKSVAPEFMGGGGSYEDNLKDYRNGEAINSAAYPNFEKPYEIYGAVKNPVLKALGGIGSAASGVSGVALRALAAMGMGGASSYLTTLGKSDQPIDDPQLQEKARHNAMIGAPVAMAAQLGIGEPVRALGGYVASKIAGNDAAMGQKAEELIASARGAAGKQKQEAVGAVENLDNARGIRPRMEAAVASPPSRMGIPPNAELYDPLYHMQGLTPQAAKQFLVDKMRMVPEAADELIAGEGAPYLAQAPGGAATEVMRKHGAGRMGELLDARVGNADRAISDYYNRPVQIPTHAEAIGQAEQGANAAAAGLAKQGAAKVGWGVVGKMTGNPLGIAGGAWMAQKGVREIARAAFQAPAVLNRLRSIPGAGRAIGNAAGKGTAALETTLLTYAKQDPKVADELQKIHGEMAPLRPEPEDT